MVPQQTPVLDTDAIVADHERRIVVCCGSGGVARRPRPRPSRSRAAEHGRRVVVLTIDPARRLAQSLGLEELDNTPRPVTGIDTSAGGSLDAMMLDMKRTFDEVVEAHAAPDKAAQILANPFYIAVSSSFAGTQEYMAMEKLGQLRGLMADGSRDWDLIIVDTPPSRSALDFLDAPKRLGSFLDGRFIRLLTAPAKVGGRASLKVFSAGVSPASGVMTKLLGGDFLRDVQTFVAAMDTMFGGFRQRADQTYALLSRPETAFVVVAAPERDAMREAGFFIERLASDRMPPAGVLINRVHVAAAKQMGPGRAEDAAAQLEEMGGHDLAAALLTVHVEVAETAARHRGVITRFRTSHPGVPLGTVPAHAVDIHDLEGLREIGEALAGR
ncbi:ArsA-related P-loop ATPase [Janibacter limosus]|uniref:ArsA family ATPase n=1 Tax=Janibacter limosus TaxID=53458 RepID=UPI0035D71171|nr:ArsA-related P-loop ATPase [Janibacter limosus]